ncbi:hypothetical protein D9615_001838 [Tricholomella constricta]|uniref:NADP-dependent oxidoreductase domain-containing protein n=1 Tax=Tricholomella constricta TaxID=117010 RepID=A0A8H5HNQ8_9AGAR|nr:hypothetical protein D9615_001838 [Tricholomella constricta]
MDTNSNKSFDEKHTPAKYGAIAVLSKEVDTAAELSFGDGELDPAEALRVSQVSRALAMAYDHHRDSDPSHFVGILACPIRTAYPSFMLIVKLRRFLFPDSPTNARFLTPKERAIAVQRIKVNQTGVENKHFKKEQLIEALLDPKTWLFALFSALDNVPNSLTNQRQIIVSSFGFTNLQTTLLGCVDGVVEIITIWTGVTIAAKIPNSRAYVATIYMVPNLLGVFLINFLPWDNKRPQRGYGKYFLGYPESSSVHHDTIVGRHDVRRSRLIRSEVVCGDLKVSTLKDYFKIDTARVYAGGTSEEYLGKINWKEKGLKLETKLFPTVGGSSGLSDVPVITHTPEDLHKHLLLSLKALNAESLEMWYLHAPDRSVPYEVTMKAVNDLYKEGYFKRFGISNYAAWEVAEIVGICKANGYIQPTAYQGIYNAVHRAVEPELFPCLRKFGISFYEFNPLGGGMFTGRYISTEDVPEPGSRFDPQKVQGKVPIFSSIIIAIGEAFLWSANTQDHHRLTRYRSRYWNEPYFQALAIIRAAAEAHNLSLPEVALRWISHHSQLSRDHGDAVLIGASSLKHIEQNLLDLEKGPLPDDMVKALDEAWLIAKPHASQYFH